MQAFRRIYERRSRVHRRLFQLLYSNPSFWVVLILYAIFSYKSFVAYQQLAQELRPDNPLCSSSRTCLHIQSPLHLALLGNILSAFALYIIITLVFWPVDYVGEDILISAAGLKDWYRWNSLMIAIPSFVVLVFMEQYDTAVPWISGFYAGFRAGLFVVYFILTMNWWTTVVAKEENEQTVQELNWCQHNRGSRLVPPEPTDLGSMSGKPKTEPDESDKRLDEADEQLEGAVLEPEEADDKAESLR